LIKEISFIFKKPSLMQDQFVEHYENFHEISLIKIIDQESTIFEYGSEFDLSTQYNTKSVYFCKN
tara:strand:+ start:678 stop:872 length:195 start_codon:yes stop_codon:yes gene_type:complete